MLMNQKRKNNWLQHELYPMLKTQQSETPQPLKRQIYDLRFRKIIKTQIIDLSHSIKTEALCSYLSTGHSLNR